MIARALQFLTIAAVALGITAVVVAVSTLIGLAVGRFIKIGQGPK